MNQLKARNHPHQQTKRSRLQDKRSQINEEISRETRLKVGAQNLLRATNDAKLKRQVELELNFMESNLQFLSSRLGALNSSVDDYQHEKVSASLPFVPIGLKETKDINFAWALKDYIHQHYAENGDSYSAEIGEFSELRRRAQKPKRDTTGIEEIENYYTALEFADRRFFSASYEFGLYFEWFDSLTGTLTMQKSVAFEKASVTFNMAALYSQMAANEDRRTVEGLDTALSLFAHAAGVFQFISESFSHPPSTDLRSDTLETLSQLMLAQAQECIYEKCCMQNRGKPPDLERCFLMAKEAAFVSKKFEKVLECVESWGGGLPSAWTDLSSIKELYYKALGHHWTGKGILKAKDTGAVVRRLFRGQFRPTPYRTFDWDPLEPPSNGREREQLAERHFRMAVQLSEEARDEWENSRDLRSSTKFRNVLFTARERAKRSWESVSNEIISELEEAAEINEISQETVLPVYPNLSFAPKMDIFWRLGPLKQFCAAKNMSPPRKIRLFRGVGSPGFGFSICGEAPVFIADVENGGLAEMGGLKSGDILVEVGEKNTKWASHDTVVGLILASEDEISLKIVRESCVEHSSTASCSSNSFSFSSSSKSYATPPTIPKKYTISQRRSYLKKLRGGSMSQLLNKSGHGWNLRKLFYPMKKPADKPTQSNPQLYMNYDQIRIP